jgi:ribosomal protein S18 acetylase RimI-like enzyme
MQEIQFFETGPEGLDGMALLWKKLTLHHAGISRHFAAEFRRMRWPDRHTDLLEKARGGALRIVFAETRPHRKLIGYCVAVIDAKKHGEIESLFVKERCRGQGVGQELVARIVAWLDRKKVKSSSVNVAVGNESAFGFYKQWGFYPRVTALVRKKYRRKGKTK